MLSYDAQRLYSLVTNHLMYTGSIRAKNILDNWKIMLPKFTKIMPVDYRRALLDIQSKTKESKEYGDINMAVGAE